MCQLDFDRIPLSIQFEYARNCEMDLEQEGDRRRRSERRDSLDVGLLGDLFQGRGENFTRAAPAIEFFPTIEMSQFEEEEAMRGRRGDDEERRCRKK